MTGLQQAAHAEGKEINEEYKRDQKLQSEWCVKRPRAKPETMRTVADLWRWTGSNLAMLLRRTSSRKPTVSCQPSALLIHRAAALICADMVSSFQVDLQDKMENQKLEVEKMRADARQLEGEAKEKELDSFVGTQLEREREWRPVAQSLEGQWLSFFSSAAAFAVETGADEPIKA